MTRLISLICLVLLFTGASARADDYAKPTWANLVRTMVKFDAFDTTDDALLDEYIIITECPLYQNFYTDDFKWNEVRAAVRKSIQSPGADFPSAYGYLTKLQLDRYDFMTKIFRFTDASAVHNVNAFLLYETEGAECGKAKPKNLPRAFRAVLDKPVNIPGLAMPPEQAKALLDQMKAEGNGGRVIYARFDMHIAFVDKLRKLFLQNGAAPIYAQGDKQSSDPFKLDARLDAVDFFMDEDATRPIGVTKP